MRWRLSWLVVLSGVTDERVQPIVDQLGGLAARQRLALGGAAAEPGVLESDGVLLLTGDPIAEAELVTALARGDASSGRQQVGDVAVKAAVIGATGFVGRALVPVLARRGEVIAVSRRGIAPDMRESARPPPTSPTRSEARSIVWRSRITSCTRSARATSPSSIAGERLCAFRPGSCRRFARLELEDAQIVLAALQGLRRPDPGGAGAALAERFAVREVTDLQQRVEAWLRESQPSCALSVRRGLTAQFVSLDSSAARLAVAARVAQQRLLD
jgi:hypothetical protein